MSETAHTFTDFSQRMTRGDELQLNVSVTKIVDGVSSAQSLATGILWLTAKRQIRDADADAIFQLNNSTLGGITVLDAAAGTARVTIPPEATEGLPDRETLLFLDLVWVDGSAKPHTCQKGTLTVYPDVMRG